MENFDIDKFAADVNNLFATVKEIIAAVHNLVGSIMTVFDKECAFCGELHVAAEE
ncbi:MAG: hypothetical protein IKB94_06460 [Clostridia bacterium]|nr:hypothetical protein [Clostridia bacterium]MBR2893480.1 hypothetical protein [Clostridia bacterium]